MCINFGDWDFSSVGGTDCPNSKYSESELSYLLMLGMSVAPVASCSMLLIVP